MTIVKIKPSYTAVIKHKNHQPIHTISAIVFFSVNHLSRNHNNNESICVIFNNDLLQQ